jgi:hypothetical protein
MTQKICRLALTLWLLTFGAVSAAEPVSSSFRLWRDQRLHGIHLDCQGTGNLS